jgi:hypothetical protein
MSGKHRIPTPARPRLRGTLTAGLVLAATLAAAHLGDAGPGGFDPKLAAAASPESGITSPIRRADTAGAEIAETALKNVSVEPAKARAEKGAKKGARKTGETRPVLFGANPDSGEKGPVTASDVIKLAKKQVGISETNGNGGGTKFQKWYAKSDRAKVTVARDGGSLRGYKNAPWCSIFISWLGHKLDFNDQLGSDAWTVAHAEWFKNQGRWGHKPKRGAVVFFSWSGSGSTDDIDHVGLVVKKLGKGQIKTIEGNINDAVTKQMRSTSLVVGYGYPDYAK